MNATRRSPVQESWVDSADPLLPEKSLLCAIIIRATYDIDQYLERPIEHRNIYSHRLAKEAYDFIHAQGIYTRLAHSDYSFNYIMEKLFGSTDAHYALRIKRKYAILPPPTEFTPTDDYTAKRQTKRYKFTFR